MAIATRTLKDTKIASGSGAAGGKVTVLVNMDDNTTANSNILDASGLAGHVQIQFKGASSDTVAIQLAGTGHYDGTAGKIENNATNTTATSGDLELTALGTSGSVIIELRKDESFTA